MSTKFSFGHAHNMAVSWGEESEKAFYQKIIVQ